MASTSARNGRRSLATLLRELAGDGRRLVRQELRLAKLETAELARGVGVGAGLVAVAAVLGVIGLITLVTAVIMLVGGPWLGEQYWLAALAVTLLLTIGAAIMAWRGARLMEPARLAPDETMATLREDREWVKRQLTSGATSN